MAALSSFTIGAMRHSVARIAAVSAGSNETV